MNQTSHRHAASGCGRWAIVGLCALLLASASQAQNHASQPPDESMWLAASDRTLDRLRGGFYLGTGLLVSFGISRAVYINDQLVTTTSFQLGNIARFTPAQAVVLSQQIASQVQIVQNGPRNTVEPGTLTMPLATYIQNTLNNQTLRTQTVIQASTNGLSALKSMNLQATISETVANAFASR
ncbi:MAG: hypothetical protein JJD98_11600 [Polaromonas sp.]|nr:hypothetical protein [Polaromonas sp.]